MVCIINKTNAFLGHFLEGSVTKCIKVCNSVTINLKGGKGAGEE